MKLKERIARKLVELGWINMEPKKAYQITEDVVQAVIDKVKEDDPQATSEIIALEEALNLIEMYEEELE